MSHIKITELENYQIFWHVWINTFLKSNWKVLKRIDFKWIWTFIIFDALDLRPSLIWIWNEYQNWCQSIIWLTHSIESTDSTIIPGNGKLYLYHITFDDVAGVIDDIISNNIYLYLWQPLSLTIWWQHPERETLLFCVSFFLGNFECHSIFDHIYKRLAPLFYSIKKNDFYTDWQFNASHDIDYKHLESTQ